MYESRSVTQNVYGWCIQSKYVTVANKRKGGWRDRGKEAGRHVSQLVGKRWMNVWTWAGVPVDGQIENVKQ